MEQSRILIDTSILIEHLRKVNKNKSTFYQLSQRFECIISVITQYEFEIGITPKNHQFSKALLSNVEIIDFDIHCKNTALEIHHHLKSQNQLIPPPDIFIAATAIAHDLPLCSLNIKHFQNIPNLQFNL